MKIRRIVCPSDFSAFSQRALELALGLAQRYQAGIGAIHVIAPRPALPGGTPDRDRLLDELSRFVEPARELGLSTTMTLLEGDVAGEVLRWAEEWSADLMVLGGRRLGQRERWALGSVAREILQHAPGPVLIASGAVETPRPAARAAFRRILCPFDFSEPAREALDYALSLAREFEARLALLHVLEWFPEEASRDHLHFNVPELQLDLAQSARDGLRRAVPEDAGGWCEREEIVAIGRPHREILRVAREREADLIVLGVHGRRALDQTLFGSTVCHLVREASCPVLLVRPQDEKAATAQVAAWR